MKQIQTFLFLLLLLPLKLTAIQLEDRMPKSVWQTEISLKFIPSYSRAFNGYGKESPLQNLLLWDRGWYDLVGGELRREEKKLELKLAYGLTEDWVVAIMIPFIQKIQISSLKFDSGTAEQQKVISNLSSEELNGLGDISIQFGKDLSYSTTFHNIGGFTSRLPTGNKGIRRGINSNSIGEGHGSLGVFFHITWYPLVHGLRNSWRIEGKNELTGERETLEGEKVYYSAGHIADIFYSWSIERQNIFAGTEIHYFQQSESKLPLGKSNDSFLKEINFEFGYGNLSELEKKPLLYPWQFRLSYSKSLAGQNIPLINSWEFSSTFLF